MAQANRGRVAGALILVLAGLFLFAVQFVPGLQLLLPNEQNWPLIIVGVGALFYIMALVTWTPALMVPGTLIAGIGGIIFWQNAVGGWGSWAYVWTLFPGLAGIGTFLMFLMQGDLRRAISAGVWPVVVSIILFLIFGSLFGAIALIGQWWPLLLIALGVILLARGVLRRDER